MIGTKLGDKKAPGTSYNEIPRKQDRSYRCLPTTRFITSIPKKTGIVKLIPVQITEQHLLKTAIGLGFLTGHYMNLTLSLLMASPNAAFRFLRRGSTAQGISPASSFVMTS
jgi:hypothetical protein